MLNELDYDPAYGAAPNPSDLIRRAAGDQSDLATVLVIGARGRYAAGHIASNLYHIKAVNWNIRTMQRKNVLAL
jgi:hypothetical protein